MNGVTLDIGTIRYPGEKGAFGVLLVASFLTLAVLVMVVLTAPPAAWAGLLFYVGLFLLVSWLAKILALASIRGHGIRVTENQYPQIHENARQFAARLGLKKTPEVYVIQATLMNAFATKVIGRRYVVLYSHLVDAALESGDYDEVAMILGHEMA
ncbi:MAG: M48 family metalloprotease, partial [Terriglobia bacterium]